jgi:hypothetical protein
MIQEKIICASKVRLVLIDESDWNLNLSNNLLTHHLLPSFLRDLIGLKSLQLQWLFTLVSSLNKSQENIKTWKIYSNTVHIFHPCPRKTTFLSFIYVQTEFIIFIYLISSIFLCAVAEIHNGDWGKSLICCKGFFCFVLFNMHLTKSVSKWKLQTFLRYRYISKTNFVYDWLLCVKLTL